MKTIDTKSLLLGCGLTIMFLTLTSGKQSNDDNQIKLFCKDHTLEIYNGKTNTLYEYGTKANGMVLTGNPARTYKIASDGSSISSD